MLTILANRATIYDVSISVIKARYEYSRSKRLRPSPGTGVQVSAAKVYLGRPYLRSTAPTPAQPVHDLLMECWSVCPL